MSEAYVVDTFVKPAVLERIDPQQFGAVPKSSTTHALIIDHHFLAQKLSSYDFPESIMCWILDFLTNRRQRVKLSCGCVSEWRAVPAGVSQGTKLGPLVISHND